MFKPATAASSLRKLLLRQNLLGRRAACPRSLSTSPRSRISYGVLTGNRKAAGAFFGLLGGLAAYQFAAELEVYAEAPLGAPSEELRRKLSVQHLQVENSWENPGVHAWGNNVGRVVAPDLNEPVIKSPRRIPFFKNMLLRDLKLDRQVGVAVTEKGDLLQWGTGYSEDIKEPEITLKGKNLIQVDLSQDRVFALSRDGSVYSLPMSKKYQTAGLKPVEPSWIPSLGSESNIHYRTLKPELGYFENVVEIAAGCDHILLLTSQGRVFSAAASSTFPTKGQTGIQGLTYDTRPKGKPYDTCHEITTLGGLKIKKIAAGDYHSLVCDDKGRVFSFGDNANGQVGFDYDAETTIVPVPRLLTFESQYPKKGVSPTVKNLAAGGANSYFVVDAEDMGGRVTSDLLSCGTGIFGNLGNGRWTHVQGPPVKVKSLSGLSECHDVSDDERAKRIIPIRPKHLSVGATHTSATMDNLTKVDASGASDSPVHDVNYGADVLWWGNNEYYQLGTGKRANSCVPVYIPPLDPIPEGMAINKASGMTGSSIQGNLIRESGVISGKGDGVGGGGFTDKGQVHRFQVTPKKRVMVGGRKVGLEQRISCGRGNTAVYSAV